MKKFFINPENKNQDKINITGPDVNHIKNVLRLNVGKEILLNDRQGHDYKCIIKEINADKVITQIISEEVNQTEPLIETVLFQSIIKGEKMDFVIQKCVEVGITKIIPIITERCVIKLESENKINKKIERWQKISESAAKQSKRGIIPKVIGPFSFNQALEWAKTNLTYYCIPYEDEKNYHLKSYLHALEKIQSIGIFIGPEGGFTKEEVQCAISKGTTPITLGKRILRSETAGLVTLANIMYELGDKLT